MFITELMAPSKTVQGRKVDIADTNSQMVYYTSLS